MPREKRSGGATDFAHCGRSLNTISSGDVPARQRIECSEASAAMNPSSGTRGPVVGAVIAVIVCLGFAAFTGHAWEDYFITFRASLNLATGHGLVFQPGERVHSFTSPLGTLLPALFAFGGDENVALRALWCLRLVSAG